MPDLIRVSILTENGNHELTSFCRKISTDRQSSVFSLRNLATV